MMRRGSWVLTAALLAGGCVGGTVDEESAVAGTNEVESLFSTNAGLIYFYVTPAGPGSTAPLALRRANAKPSSLNSTYGAPILPRVRLASDAHTSKAALDRVLATPYAGHEGAVIAIFGSRDATTSATGPLQDVVEIYTPSQPVSVSAVQQRDALFDLSFATNGNVSVQLVNEKVYSAAPASGFGYDYAASSNPAAAKIAVQGGAMFSGSVDVKCSSFLWWTNCKPPTAVHVAAFYSAN
ncbi:MAG: hypothetical protein JWN44_6816 [Myxococcales bacterium]|nr:hypothetical protein [Myxococcales bacterium]